jgi:hypothetical protein
MANRVYTGVVTDTHYDEGRGHFTVTIRMQNGITESFWTTRKQQMRQGNSWCAVGMTVTIEANPRTGYIEGFR